MKLYILSLSEYKGDTLIKFVDEETWKWIHQPYNNEIPESILEKIKERHYYNYKELYKGREELIPKFSGIRLGEKTYVNDRAIHAPSIKKEGFYCLKEKLKIIKELEEEGYSLEEEFNGYLY